MALGRAFSVAVRGLDGEIVEIEADITSGLPGVHLVVCPTPPCRSPATGSERRSPIAGTAGRWRGSRSRCRRRRCRKWDRFTTSLWPRPCFRRSERAVGPLEKTVLLGELSLDGRVRPVRGVLPAVLAAKRDGWPAVVVPVENLAEASLVDGIDVWGVRTLGQLQSWLSGSARLDHRISARATAAGAVRGSGRRGWAGASAVRRRGGRRRGASPHADRAAGSGQNDAGPTPSGLAAAAVGQ